MNSDFPMPAGPAAGPLKGQRILVTRAAATTDTLSAGLESLGATVLRHPVLEILPAADRQPLADAMWHLDRYRGVVWVSPNGARFWFELAAQLAIPQADLHRPEAVAIGRGTAVAVARHLGRQPRMPQESHSAALADWLIEQSQAFPNPAPWLILRGDRGSQVLPDRLREAGVPFEQLVAYRSRNLHKADPVITRALAEGQVDWVTVTSSAIAAATVGLWGPWLAGGQGGEPEKLEQHTSRARARLASISPTTSQRLRELGWEPAAEAIQANLESLVEAIVKATSA